MTNFFGCDPTELDDLASRILERMERIRRLIEAIRTLSSSVTWDGPDADGYRARTEATCAQAEQAATELGERARQLQEEAQQQEDASAAHRGEIWEIAVPLMKKFSEMGWKQPSDGPIIVPHPLPPIGLPTQQPGGGITLPQGWPVPPPAPERDEPYALDDVHLQRGRAIREEALGVVPYAGTVQSVMNLHGRAEDGIDHLEGLVAGTVLEEPLAPTIDEMRLAHSVSGAVIGEQSTLGHIAGGVDRTYGSALQTFDEVSAALGEGDAAGAARAAERGAYRHVEASIDTLAAPIAAAPAVLEDMAAHAADHLEHESPAAAGIARGVEDLAAGAGEAWDEASDLEKVYDARRRTVTMPWD